MVCVWCVGCCCVCDGGVKIGCVDGDVVCGCFGGVVRV